MSATASTSRGAVLRARIAQDQPLLVPGVYDALTALLAEQAGFEALYLSGGAVAYTQLGRSDVGLTTATETASVLARITDRVGLPVIVDGDTGYGNALNVQRTVRDFERAGAAMIQLEDQGFPKRCGHLAGKSLVSTAEMQGKLRAALDARHSRDTLILARTDAIAVEGVEAAFERAQAYLDCGVDALFIEALRSREQMQAACARFGPHTPLLANMIEGGLTPVGNAAALGELGFRIVIFPGGTARWVAAGLQHYFRTLAAEGTSQPLRAQMFDFDQLNAVIGTPELLALGQRYAGGD